jgi:hypothetical protein
VVLARELSLDFVVFERSAFCQLLYSIETADPVYNRLLDELTLDSVDFSHERFPLPLALIVISAHEDVA